MPSDIMDQRHLSSFYIPSVRSSFFSDEVRFPSERQFGFWKGGSVPDHHGLEAMSLMHRSKSISSSPLENISPAGGNYAGCLDIPNTYHFRDPKTTINIQHRLVGAESTSGIPMTSWSARDQDFASQSKLYEQPASQSVKAHKAGVNGVHYENGVFSNSLSETFNRKLILPSRDVLLGQSVDTTDSNFREDERFESLEEMIGNLLPDDDELLSGVIHDSEYAARSMRADEVEDDLFYSVGGMELEADDNFRSKKASDFAFGGALNDQEGPLNHSLAVKRPSGPSRTVFMRNINSSFEDTEQRVLFQDNHLQKNINQGALVLLNLDSSVSNNDLRHIFSAYGEIKEICETPLQKHHRFIEFYDVRAAEAALGALNKHGIAGKIVMLEPSNPGDGRRSVQHSSLQLEKEGSSRGRQERLHSYSPSERSVSPGLVTLGSSASHSLDNGANQKMHPAFQMPNSSFMETKLNGISSNELHSLSSPVRVSMVDSQCNQSRHCELNHSLELMNFGFQSMPTFHPHSLPEFHDGLIGGIPFNSSNKGSSMAMSINSRFADGIDDRHIHRVGPIGHNSHSFEQNEGAFGVSGNGSCSLHGHQYVWNTEHGHSPSSMIWQGLPPFLNNIPAQHPQQVHGLHRGSSHMLNPVIPLHQHHVGSAPVVNPSLWDGGHPYGGDCMDMATFHPNSLGSLGFSSSSQMHPMELASHNIFPHSGGHCIDPSISSSHVGIPSSQQRGHAYRGRNSMSPIPTSFDAPNDRIRSRRTDAGANLADNKKQYELDVDRIIRGEDSRTTLMIKNIPNKYTSKMLLATIDEQHKGSYDFIYLPIDFKNKCNVGYAFINMTDPEHIIPFYQAFNGKKWEKFNSEKVASLAYARIQGKGALIAHFQNSSLMNEDKRCRPILFHSDGPNAGDQEPFPVGINVRPRRSRTAAENHHGSPSGSSNGEEYSNGTGSSGSIKDLSDQI